MYWSWNQPIVWTLTLNGIYYHPIIEDGYVCQVSFFFYRDSNFRFNCRQKRQSGRIGRIAHKMKVCRKKPLFLLSAFLGSTIGVALLIYWLLTPQTIVSKALVLAGLWILAELVRGPLLLWFPWNPIASVWGNLDWIDTGPPLNG